MTRFSQCKPNDPAGTAVTVINCRTRYPMLYLGQQIWIKPDPEGRRYASYLYIPWKEAQIDHLYFAHVALVDNKEAPTGLWVDEDTLDHIKA